MTWVPVILLGIVGAIGVLICLFIHTIRVKTAEARRELEHRSKRYDMMLMREWHHFSFNMENVERDGGSIPRPMTVSTKPKYPWLHFQNGQCLFTVDDEVKTWLTQNTTDDFRIANDEVLDSFIVAFRSQDDQFAFKMRWM